MPSEKQIAGAKARATGGARKRCRRGKSCGATCIAASKMCLVDIPWVMAPKVSKLAKAVTRQVEQERAPVAPASSVKPRKMAESAQDQENALKRLEASFQGSGFRTMTLGPQTLRISGKTRSGKDVMLSVKKEEGFAQISVGFKINSSYDRAANMDRREKIESALMVKRIYKMVTDQLREGSAVAVSAYAGDDAGPQRVKAYEAMGFTSVDRPGQTQYSYKQPNGSMKSTRIGESPDLGSMAFSEKDTVKHWLTVLF